MMFVAAVYSGLSSLGTQDSEAAMLPNEARPIGTAISSRAPLFLSDFLACLKMIVATTPKIIANRSQLVIVQIACNFTW